jgi:hypothetical protein
VSESSDGNRSKGVVVWDVKMRYPTDRPGEDREGRVSDFPDEKSAREWAAAAIVRTGAVQVTLIARIESSDQEDSDRG